SLSAGPQVDLEIYDSTRSQEYFPGINFDEQAVAPFYCGYRIEVASMATARELLTRNAVDMVDLGERILIQPTQSCGAMIEFVEA
ncbi:MAG: hypothetical protein AAGF46_11775, partial [Pseudomonadota bacterium]